MIRKYASKTEDVKYYFHKSQAENADNPRCVFVFVHGLRDHAGTHSFFFEQLNKEGCHILSFDLLGHGYSAGERCAIDDYKNHVFVVWRSIILALKKHTPQGIPIVIMGYSYGFSLVVHALNELTGKHSSIEKIIRKRVALVIGLNPAFKVGHTTSSFLRFFAPVFVFLSRHIKNIPFKSIQAENITDDEQILNIIETDPKVFKGKINVQTARNVYIAGETALRILPTIRLPFLLMFGSEDFVQPVTKEETNNREDIYIRIIQGGKHNIFDGNNIYAGRTLESIMRAIDQYC